MLVIALLSIYKKDREGLIFSGIFLVALVVLGIIAQYIIKGNP